MGELNDLESIIAAVEADLEFNDLNVMEKALRLPAIKHFWVGRYIRAKVELKKREQERANLIKTLETSDRFTEVNLSKDSLRKMWMASPKMQEISERIDELNFIIDYLNDAKYVLGRATDDIKNFIEVRKLELM